MENTNVLFDRKRLVRLIVPLIVEQGPLPSVWQTW